MKDYSDYERNYDLDDSNKVENCKFCYEQINNWISNADNKISISCAVFTFVFTVFSYLSYNFISDSDWMFWNKIYQFASFFSLVLLFLSFVFYFRALTPNLTSLATNKYDKKFPIFFMDISDCDLDDYKSRILTSAPNDFLDELCSEIWINSVICQKKMQNYKIGIKLSIHSICIVFLSF